MIAALRLTVKEVNSSDPIHIRGTASLKMKSMSFWKSSVACAVFREMRESSKGIYMKQHTRLMRQMMNQC